MKHKISYVFPNISAFNRNGRGGLHKRYEIAAATNCSFIEVPADFIKNKTEVQLMGKKLGSILTAEEVEKLYEFGTPSENRRVRSSRAVARIGFLKQVKKNTD